MEYRLDMSVMFTIHDAFRRDLAEIARVAAEDERNGCRSLQSHLGWGFFKKILLIHHQTEDDVVWPVLRAHVKDSPDRAALVDELEAEHAAIEPLFHAIDEAPDSQQSCRSRLVELVNELVTCLTGHLVHEEAEGLTLIDEFLTLEEWQTFARVHGGRLVDDASTYVPWLLDQADPGAVESFLSNIPPPLAASYREEWAAEYATLEIWDAPSRSSSSRQD
jgi:Hemerythrin HHE cation binding domain